MGEAVKTILLATKTGQLVLEGVTLAQKFIQGALRPLSQFVKDAQALRELTQAIRDLAEKVIISGKKAGVWIQETIDRLGEQIINYSTIAAEIGKYAKGALDGVRTMKSALEWLGETCFLLGSDMTGKGITGSLRLYGRLFAEGAEWPERYIDFLTYFNGAGTAAERASLLATLEAAHDAVEAAGTGRPTFYLKGMEAVHSTAYRYQSWDPRFDVGGTPITGPPKLLSSTMPPEGWYISFDKFTDSDVARRKMELIPQNTAEYRLEIDTASISGNIQMPYGDHNAAPYAEPVCVDFPDLPGPGLGIGSATQGLVKQSSISVTAIYRIIGGVETRLY